MTTTTQQKLPGVKNNPMKQKTIDDKAVLHQTPPKELLDAAGFYFSKKEALTTSKSNLERADEELKMTMRGLKIKTAIVKDNREATKKITLCEGKARLKISVA